MMDEIYNEAYYHSGCGPIPYEEPEHWVRFFGYIADRIVEDLHPKTVLDAGCAMGYLVAALRDRGIDAYGIDISNYAISKVREDVRPYCIVGSLSEAIDHSVLPTHFDLVTSVEVLEHMSEEDGKKAIATFCKLTDRIIFSSTPDDITEPTHINVRQREYWARMFAENGFIDDLNYRPTYLTEYASCFKRDSDWLGQLEDYEKFIASSDRKYNESQQSWKRVLEEKEHHIQKQNNLLEETMENYRNLEDSYRSDTVSFHRQITQLQENHSQSQLRAAREMSDLAKDMAVLVQKHSEQGEENTKLSAEIACLQGEKDRLEGVVDRLQKSLDAANEESKQLLQTNRGLTDENEKLAQELETYKEYYLMAIEERNDLTNKLACLQESLDAANEESKRLLQTNRGLTDENEQITQELATYKEHYLMAIDQRNELTNKVTWLQESYDAVMDSFSWRVTKPLRKLSGGMKKILKVNKYTYLFGKGMKHLLKYGFKPTWAKVKNKVRTHYGRRWTVANECGIAEERECIPEEIKFSILVPLYNTYETYLREMIQSVRDQIYSNWELCLADGSDAEHGYVEQICKQYAAEDSRIRYSRLTENRGISENTNACAKMATGDYIALLDHDDVYSPDALYYNAKAIYETNADVLYSDEDHLALNGKHVNPFYKPDWSPDLLYSQMYICHLLVFRKTLFETVGGFCGEFDGSQDYDLMLRFSEETERICHIPRILYSWRESETSTAANASAKPYAHVAGKNALDAHLKRKYGSRAYAEESEYLFVYQPRFASEETPLVSIIIPMKDHWEMSDACIRSIFEKSTYANYEIIVLNNRSEKEDTYAWFEAVQEDHRVRVVEADMEFNWSKLNNFGVHHASGEVFVFLNNDTLVISEDWLERLVENTLRPDIGVVGGLLLYEDNTIQHAGVVVGIGGWADHIFKGMSPVHYGAPYVSPMVSRNVLAVTGACMAVSRATLDKIGFFDEEFIICGSDVELGIRAHDFGLYNRYDANVRLYHLESKSRDSYIPEIDFKKSYEAYGPYRENIDPYFNINLDINSVIPKETGAPMNLVNFKNFLKRIPFVANTYHALQHAWMETSGYAVAEIGCLEPRVGHCDKKRLNLLVPSVNRAHVFGGISTALKFYESMARCGDFSLRIITLDAPVDSASCVLSEEYVLVKPEEESLAPKQVLPMADRYNRTFPVAENDIFVATSWWSAYVIRDVLDWQNEQYGKVHPLVYFIQDYEPGFYPWSSRYMMADSTYRSELPVYAIFNSKLLHDYFMEKGYRFAKTWYFEPTLNESLRQFLPEQGAVVPKKKQILVYGRPNTARNAFELLVYALKEWAAKQEDVAEWTVLSAGELHNDVDLGNGAVLHSVGKLSLQDYAKTMLDTYAGVSLMVSPHPSYPPLEMATFGVKTITNCYDGKDLTSFSENMVSLSSCAPRDIARKLLELCNHYDGQGVIDVNPEYTRETAVFGCIPEQVWAELAEDAEAAGE